MPGLRRLVFLLSGGWLGERRLGLCKVLPQATGEGGLMAEVRLEGICSWGSCVQRYAGELFGVVIPPGIPLCRFHHALLENWRGRYQANPATFFTLKGLGNDIP